MKGKTTFLFVFIEVLSGALRGISDVIIPTLLTLFGTCLLRIAWIFLAVPHKPCIEMVIVSYPITWFTTAILFLIYYQIKKRRMGR